MSSIASLTKLQVNTNVNGNTVVTGGIVEEVEEMLIIKINKK
jgi:hypothetical protein